MREQIGKVVMNYEYYKGEDGYSEGEVEEQLLELVTKYKESEYNAVIAQTKSWPVLYHLSHIRKNIIEWLPITKEDTVLEIGAGCGAISGQLAHMAKQLTCLELSKKRSLINAQRNHQRDNMEIIVGNFADIESNLVNKYEYVVLIGVLEYAASYVKAANPYVEMLKKAVELLTPQGKIIIAIENRLGLKYWAGCKEDHLGEYYKGLEGYEDPAGVRTFSKNELQSIIQEAGLNRMKFYYPYPDYKLPSTIYSAERLPLKNELTENLRNFDYGRIVSFDERLVYNTLIDNHAFEMFSNSFLIVIEKE